ncbi:MAG: DNA-binding GntR family transcriptional regulator [Celeribacter sp.]|jgi:DNA-binding GntR family transcriptional regulator
MEKMIDKTLPEQIADKLRRDILKGALSPGQQIKERDHATELDVSRTPMREAIRILSKEGLVLLRPSRSPIVADPSFEEISDVVEVLTALELRCGALACKNATDDDIARIQRMHDNMKELQGKIGRIDFFELDMEFHMAIAAASKNTVLAETHSAFVRRLWRARYLSASRKESADRVKRQHGAIMTALCARDTDLMYTEITAHLDALIENIRDKYASEADDT